MTVVKHSTIFGKSAGVVGNNKSILGKSRATFGNNSRLVPNSGLILPKNNSIVAKNTCVFSNNTHVFINNSLVYGQKRNIYIFTSFSPSILIHTTAEICVVLLLPKITPTTHTYKLNINNKREVTDVSLSR